MFKRKNISSHSQGAPAPSAAFGVDAQDVAADASASMPTPVDVSDGAAPGASAGSSNAKPSKKKRRISPSTVIIVLVLIAGIGIFCYPAISDWWNSMHATRAIAAYQEAVAELTEEEKAALFAQARDYNKHLDALPDRFGGAPSINNEYEQAFNVTGDGIMGYVTIDKIDVNLPIYHGTSEGVLQIAAGHLEGSHLPTGDAGNHSVVSAHRGLPSAVLFSYLDELHEGDYFSITVLDTEFDYQVDQVLIVEPGQLDALMSEEGIEYATLQTCTPYGVNSHRLLVRGHRVDGIPDFGAESDARRVPIHIMAPAVAVPILLLALIILLLANRRKPVRVTEADRRAVSIAPDITRKTGASDTPDMPDEGPSTEASAAGDSPAGAPEVNNPTVEDSDARRKDHER